tara:strand:- start:23 stop:247 length:225 start_codon:yes stop_codon:yes gene_type:complete
MPIFYKKKFISSFLFVLIFLTSACTKMNNDEPFSFYKTFVNPDYVEVELEDYSENISISDEKVDLESVPDGELE